MAAGTEAADVHPEKIDVRVGQAVYRVVEHDPYPSEGEITWQVAERRIAQVTRLKLRLDRPFPGSTNHGLLLRSVSVGRLFHLTIADALEHFRAVALRNLAHHDRMKDAAKRELDWWAKESEAQRRRDDAAATTRVDEGALFIVLGARDDSDMEQTTIDYAVCYLDEEIAASRLAERMNELAHKLEAIMSPTEEAVREMRALDPRWERGRSWTERPTQYRVERTPGRRVEP